MKFPPSSTGFVLDGFPQYPDEVQFLGKYGFFPDAAVFIQIDRSLHDAIFFRMLVKSILIGFSIIFKKCVSITIDFGGVLIWRVIKIGAHKVNT